MKFEYTFFANPPLAVFGSARVSARLAALPVCSGPLVLFCFLKKTNTEIEMCPTRPEKFGGSGPRGPDPPNKATTKYRESF